MCSAAVALSTTVTIDRSAIRRGLQAGPSQPYHRADSTDSSETGAPVPVRLAARLAATRPPVQLRPLVQQIRQVRQRYRQLQPSRARDKSTAPPPTWAELDARFYAESAAESSAKQGLAPGAPSSTAGATSSTARATSSTSGATSSTTGLTTALPVPPPSWAELAYRMFYAERAARSTTEQGVPPGGTHEGHPWTRGPPMDQPPTWADLVAQHYAALAARCQPLAAEQRVELGSSEEELVAAAQALTGISDSVHLS